MVDFPSFRSRVIPVVSIDSAAQAVPLAEALLAGGIDVIEITLRRPGGLPGIAELARRSLPICVGAGTLLDGDDVRRAVDAGARFGLSPGCTPALADAVLRARLPFVPGIMTPSEVMAARALGFQLMKLFPAAQAGGIAMLRAMAGPLQDVRFIPTGGVRADALAEWLREPNVERVGGTWIAPVDLIERADWTGIARLAREASAAAQA
ncbi:MAG: bifunctional 4-hydroxy-2-oxoglutarate aldolase/2-dehydro-3-deoxy-phosphogluconate aldolase [Betaproteobacteria bacterium]